MIISIVQEFPSRKKKTFSVPRKDLMLPAWHPAVLRDKEARVEARKRNANKLLGFCENAGGLQLCGLCTAVVMGVRQGASIRT